MNFRPQTTIKGQVLADFIAKFTYSNTAEVTGMTNNTETVKAPGVREKEDSVPIKGYVKQWTLYVDGASNDTRSRVCMMLINPKGTRYIVPYALDLRRQITKPNMRP